MKEKLLDKIIAGMEYCTQDDACDRCPYTFDEKFYTCITELHADVLYYLKRQRDLESEVIAMMAEMDENMKAEIKKGEL